MIKSFKEKAPRVQAVELTSISTQLTEVADLLKADSYKVDLGKKQATFTVGQDTYVAVEGQVIAVSGDTITIYESDDFYAKYEKVE